MSAYAFPPLPLATWEETRDTVRTYAQLAGKIRRVLTPAQKHWWHVSLRVAAAGLTTTPIPAGDQVFELLLDLTRHSLEISSSRGERQAIPLEGQSPFSLKEAVLETLSAWGIHPEIDHTLFEDKRPGGYDRVAIGRFWPALAQIDAVLKELRHSFRGESSPVQLWPHHFDLAVLWFSGRLVPEQDPADPEWSDEQMNFGFSTGDDGIPEPYFYVTAYPAPESFTSAKLPEGAHWHTEGWTGAVLPYAALAGTTDGQAQLLAFLRAAHEAGAKHMRAM